VPVRAGSPARRVDILAGSNKEMTMLTLTRRQFLQHSGAGATALVLIPVSVLGAEAKAAAFTLPKLPYDYDALEPHIDAETMRIHHDKHHQAYVNNLNQALAMSPDLQNKSIEELLANLATIPEKIRTAVRNNGGGHANHSMFWEMMAKGGGKPSGELAKAIDDAFGSFDKFQTQFSQAAITRFGSGWAWLVPGKDKLEVISSPNQDTPLMKGNDPVMKGVAPILGIDVWEHAYYLKYKNMRPDYVKAWWNVVNWKNVAERYSLARKAT
jgi:Fe-Mn family superoxide dismutase